MPSDDVLLRSKLKLGRKLLEAKRFEEARQVYEQICARRKNDADSWYTLGVINGVLRRPDAAASCCSKAVALAPDHSAGWYNLGIALRDLEQLEEAAGALRKALALNPGHDAAATSLGHILATLHRYDEAEEVFRNVLAYQPGNAEFYAVYGSIMQIMLGRYEAAINAYRKAVELRHPRSADLLENMAAALCLQGRYNESIEVFETALRREPDNARIYSSLLLTLQYTDQNPAEQFERHRRWPGNTLPARPARALPAERPQRLRIGYMSSDLRKHSVAYFVEPLLRGHDPERFEITCYFTHKESDAVTARLRSLAHRWRNVSELDDQQLLHTIADDGIHVLVDLNGHTSGGRLTVFAQRAAPIQVSFIGYPDTTGLKEMDYRLTDAVADPPRSEQFCTESLVRLPGCFLCYQPQDNAPDVAPAPSERNGFVTFGSFNNLAKVNARVASVWARLLKDVPGSRLIMKNHSLTDPSTRERYLALFAELDIPADRLNLISYMADDSDHLGAYGSIDIALDTFPYNGTTTTCEALWMGVPVVSLCGERHSARVGASLLTAVGSSDWIADTVDQYIAVARHLAQDLPGLARIRADLRERMRASPLCSPHGYVSALERIYDDMVAAAPMPGRN